MVIHVLEEPLLSEPLLGHGLLIELDVLLREEVVLGLITCVGEVLVIGPHLLGEVHRGSYYYLTSEKLKGRRNCLRIMKNEEEWNGMEWNLMEVSGLRSGRLSKQKKLPIQRRVAPAGWTSTGLRALHTGGWAGGPDGTCRGHFKKRLHFSIRACHPCACPCYSSLYHSSEKLCSSSLRRCLSLQCSCRRGDLLTRTLSEKEYKKKLARAQANVPSRFQSRVEHANSTRLSHAVVHHRSSTISRILQFTPRNCTQKKERHVISGAMLLKKEKNTICALSVHAHASTQVSFMSSQATLHQGRVNLCIVQI